MLFRSGHDVVPFASGSRVKDFRIDDLSRVIEAADHSPLLHGPRITFGGHHDADRRTRIPFGGLYFALAAMVDRFHYLKYALAILLVFIGSKIFVADALGLAKIPPPVSLGITFLILAGGIGWSLWKTRSQAALPRANE